MKDRYGVGLLVASRKSKFIMYSFLPMVKLLFLASKRVGGFFVAEFLYYLMLSYFVIIVGYLLTTRLFGCPI